jgi:hypothetical protein
MHKNLTFVHLQLLKNYLVITISVKNYQQWLQLKHKCQRHEKTGTLMPLLVGMQNGIAAIENNLVVPQKIKNNYHMNQ